jgi:hypothetical protein
MQTAATSFVKNIIALTTILNLNKAVDKQSFFMNYGSI